MRAFLWLLARCVGVTTLFFLITAGTASAEYPDRLVRVVVPYPSGGGVDLLARSLAERLRQRWGQSVIVENKPGGGTNIGANAVAKAKPDGYVLLLTTDSTVTTNPHLFKQMPFDPMKDLVPVVHIVNLNFVVLVNPKVAAKNMAELVALAKASNAGLTFSSAGNGSQAHLMFEALNQAAGTKLSHIPYAGIAPALQAVVAGEVDIGLGGGTSFSFIESGRVRPVAVSGEKRIPALASVPTLKEAGYAQMDARGWVGLFAPAGTPANVTAKIEKDVRAILFDPAYQKAYLENSIAFSAPADSSARAFTEFLRQDFEFKKKLVEAARVKID